MTTQTQTPMFVFDSDVEAVLDEQDWQLSSGVGLGASGPPFACDGFWSPGIDVYEKFDSIEIVDDLDELAMRHAWQQATGGQNV